MSGIGPKITAGFPSGPLVDPDTGWLTPEWRAFLYVLWNRTGGPVGQSTDTSALQADLAAETTARQAGDAALHSQITSEAAARSAADANLGGAINQEADTRAGAISNEIAARVAGDTAAHWASLSFSSLPTTNPGGGLPWLSGGNIHVGP